MGRKSAGAASTKASSSTATAASSTAAPTSKPSILKSAFAPSRYQLRLFASVIQSFDSQQLRIHDTSNGRLRCQHVIKSNTTVACLDWGQFNPTKSHSSSRKRKSVNSQDVVVAYGTSDSEICLFSPAEGKVIGHLLGGHERGVRDFKFSSHQRNDAWSLGGDGKLVLWNLKTSEAVRSISLPDPLVGILSQPSSSSPTILCASSTPFMVDIQSGDASQIQSFDSMKSPIHAILRSDHDRDGTTELFLTADSGRHIHVYDIEQKRLVRTLIAASEVVEADLFVGDHGNRPSWDEQLLAITTTDGSVELFARPFVQPTNANGELKSRRKSLTQKATARVQLVESDSMRTPAPIFTASLQGPELLVVSVDSGVEVSFQKIRWQDEGTGELLFDGVKEVARSRAASSLNTAIANGVKDLTKSQVDESKTVVVNGMAEGSSQIAAIELDDSDDDDDKDEEEEAVEEHPSEDEAASATSDSDAEGERNSDEIMQDVTDPTSITVPQEDGDDVEDVGGPSFGDMLATSHPNTIDVASSFVIDQNQAVEVNNGLLNLPTGMSLGTVLTQALRTNDRNLLEACLHTTDRDVISNTIKRLESPLAGILVGKIAERMASRPGRYGDLQVWVQQLCVAHGAAISTMPEAKAKLKTLFKVLDQRAKTLTPLLLLKGKLDMLDAQLRFRQQLATERASRQAQGGGMVFVEGEADNWSSDEDIDETGNAKRKGKQPKRLALEDLIDEEGSDDDSDMPLTNGINHSASDSNEETDGEDDVNPRHDRLVDDIAEEEDEAEDLDDEEEADSDDDDEEDEDLEEEDEADSEMDDFIDDGPLQQVEDDGLLDDAEEDEEDEAPKKPAKKRRKY